MPADPPLPPPLVTAEHLAHRYGRRPRGLLDAHFAAAGRAPGVLGPPGAGKSTLLSLLTAARLPSGGTLRVGGLDPSDRDQRRQLQGPIGYVPESMSVYPAHSVGQFLRYVGWLRGVPPALLPAAISDSLLVTDLTDLRDRPVRTLSAGMRKRVLLAQALVNRPSVVVLDSPAVVLDPEQRAQFLARVIALRGRCAVVLATPLVETVAAPCDEVVVLAGGRTVFGGTTAELAGGEPGGDALAAGHRRALAAAWGAAG
ncbi:MAG: ABC transporter ATP-binding protein [Actinomycetota bacterium]